nr:zinc finger MYM-type protein 1-like [Onthophagus taurus]
MNKASITVEIKEHFLGFCPITNTTDDGLTNFLLDYLDKQNIDIQDMRGQGYDNGANMRGKHNGLQKKILDINSRAFYIPCSSHTLNLIVNDAANSSLEICSFVDLIHEIYVFFSASPHRWHVFKNECPTLTLKPLSDTRWESRVEAVKVFKYNLPLVYDALYELYSDSTTNASTRNTAKSLLTKIKSFKFVCSPLIWYNILTKINIVSKLMQEEHAIISTIITMLSDLESYLMECRTDKIFATILKEAELIAKEMDCDCKSPDANTIRPRKKKKII